MQLATRASSRGLIHSCERLLEADSLTCKIIIIISLTVSLTRQASLS